MAKVQMDDPPYSSYIVGKIGEDVTPLPFYWWGIYQMRMCKEGKIPIRMKFYKPSDPKTIPQQANRSKFGDAVLAWQNLTYQQKQEYNRQASGNRFTGYHLFIRLFMLS